MVGGAILVSLITQNPSALGGAVAAGSRIEGRFQEQRAMKKEEIAAIERAIADAVIQNGQRQLLTY